FVVRNMLLTILTDGFFSTWIIFMQDDTSTQLFSIFMVWHPNYLYVRNCRMSIKEIFNFFREQVFSATNDDILDSALNFDKAFIIHFSNITGMHPARRINHFLSFFLIFPITQHHGIATYTQFAQLTAWNHLAIFIDNFNFQMRMYPANCTNTSFDTVCR